MKKQEIIFHKHCKQFHRKSETLKQSLLLALQNSSKSPGTISIVRKSMYRDRFTSLVYVISKHEKTEIDLPQKRQAKELRS